MPDNITPRKMQQAVRAGFKRLEHFRRARLLYLKQFVGQYYDKEHGKVGDEPLNMIFNAIRVLVPNIVMSFPKHEVSSKMTAYRNYAEMAELALDAQAEDSNIRDTYRRWLVDALFAVGIVKTGLCQSGSLLNFDDDDDVDPGSVYTEVVDFDNFVADASCHRWEESSFLGNAIRVPRYQLLDSGLYKNDLVMKLKKSSQDQAGQGGYGGRSEKLSMKNVTEDEVAGFHDYVDVVELWVPRANSIVTVPREDMVLDDYLRVEDYYGPDRPTGPYTMLSLTQPVPNNPMPVAPVGIWYDLHIMGNKMCKKILTQAERQKNIVVYKRSGADDAQEVVDSEDGEAIGIDGEPSDVQTLSFGGQEKSNEVHMAQVEGWFNRISGNTEALGGQRSDANTATQAQILQGNSAVGIEDMRDAVYSAAASEASLRFWLMHNDPLIEIPLIKRTQVPAKWGQFGSMPRLLGAGRMEDRQIILTPEARQGDFLDYHISIKMKSMSRMAPELKQRLMMEFIVKALPAVMNAALISSQLNLPMSPMALLSRLAKENDIEWFDEVWYDEAFQEQVAMVLASTPGPQGSQGTMGTGLQSNGQPGSAAKVRSAGQEQHRGFQMGSADSQSDMNNNQRY